MLPLGCIASRTLALSLLSLGCSPSTSNSPSASATFAKVMLLLDATKLGTRGVPCSLCAWRDKVLLAVW